LEDFSRQRKIPLFREGSSYIMDLKIFIEEVVQSFEEKDFETLLRRFQ
jgi:hypothetical protein